MNKYGCRANDARKEAKIILMNITEQIENQLSELRTTVRWEAFSELFHPSFLFRYFSRNVGSRASAAQ